MMTLGMLTDATHIRRGRNAPGLREYMLARPATFQT